MTLDRSAPLPAWRALLPFAALFLLVILSRGPFVSMTLAGEEGEFGRSVAMVAQGHLPRGIIARASNGHEFEIPAGHNLGGYLFAGALFVPVMHFTGFTALPQRRRAAIGLRACFAFLYGLMLMFALGLLSPERRIRGALALGAFGLCTLPLLGSVQVNYDGAVSGLIVVASLYLFSRARGGASLGWAAAAGALSSFGKLEFAIALTAALFLTAALDRRPRLWLVFGAAQLLGLFCFWRLDPVNFVYGYGLIGRYWNTQGGTHAPILARAWTYARTNAALLWPLFATIGLVLPWHFARRRFTAVAPMALTFLFIVGGYLAIAWRGDGFPRYFAPCFALAGLLVAELDAPAIAPLLLSAGLLLVGLQQYRPLFADRENALGRLVSAHDGLALAQRLEASPRDCITVTDMDAGVGFYSRTASFACCWAQWTDWPKQEHESLCP